MTVSIVTVLGRKGCTNGPSDSSFWKGITCYLSVNFLGKKSKQIFNRTGKLFMEKQKYRNSAFKKRILLDRVVLIMGY